MEDKVIYCLDDNISFRKCTLFDGKSLVHGNCTNFTESQENWKDYYSCNQYGIHLHCTKHPEVELDLVNNSYSNATLRCPKCKKEFEIDSFKMTINRCLKLLNIEEFKGAKLIRLNDWYVPEIKKKEKIGMDYWIEADVKTDKDGDTIVILYIGHTGTKEKSQFFIKPEKCQLTSDHKDLDPAKILSKIEVTLKSRTISQKYTED